MVRTTPARPCGICCKPNSASPPIAPFSGTAFDLAAGKLTVYTEGRKIELKGHARTQKVYDTLVQAAQQLLDVAKRSKGQSNKELAKFTSQIKNLLERWQ